MYLYPRLCKPSVGRDTECSTRACPFFLLVETPLHAGSGTVLGVVDLPIQRERHTGFPKIEASGLKGSIREAFEQLGKSPERLKKLKDKFSGLKDKQYWQVINLVFGPKEGDLYAAPSFTDAHLLLFPVRSAAHSVFAWVTCPAALNRLVRELRLTGISDLPPLPEAGTVPPGLTCASCPALLRPTGSELHWPASGRK